MGASPGAATPGSLKASWKLTQEGTLLLGARRGRGGALTAASGARSASARFFDGLVSDGCFWSLVSDVCFLSGLRGAERYYYCA